MEGETMATYLVTGATGFLGMHLCERLLVEGHRVRALCRQDAPHLTDVGIEVVRGDVLDRSGLSAALKGMDAVYHLAGRVSRNSDDALELHRLHVQGTQNVLEACKATRTGRLVHCSTSGTVGVSDPPGVELDENAAPDLTVLGRWPYYLSKLFAEQSVLAAGKDGMCVVIVNPSLLLGPGDTRGDSTRDVRLFMERKIPGVPQGGVAIVDVRDVAEALSRAMEKGRSGQRYLVSALNTTVKDFFDRLSRVSQVPAPVLPLSRTLGTLSARMLDGVARTLDGSNPLDAVSVEMASYCWYVSSRKAQTELGVQFRDPNETLHDTVEDLRRQGVRSQGSLPAGAGLAESLLGDALRAAERWRKRILDERAS
jgi:dihydroflavonol-4-reductase